MNLYRRWSEKWNEDRTRIPKGPYSLRCIEASYTTSREWGEKGWLLFEVVEGDRRGEQIPMFFNLPRGGKGKIDENGRISQGSNYYLAWGIANGNRKPTRARLKEMAISKFKGKVFLGVVVDSIPRFNGPDSPDQPEFTHYSRVKLLQELIMRDTY